MSERLDGMSRASTHFNNDLRYRDEAHPRQVHLTPPYVLEPVRKLLGRIELDPCTEPDNPTGATRFYAPPVDGAEQPWNAATIFVNPPYGKARERWVARCIEAGRIGSKVVLLMPAHTDTRVFQRALRTAYSVMFLQGRVKFGVLRPNRRQVAASHASALLGWNVDLGRLRGVDGTAITTDNALVTAPTCDDGGAHQWTPCRTCDDGNHRCEACGGHRETMYQTA